VGLGQETKLAWGEQTFKKLAKENGTKEARRQQRS